MWFKCPTKTSLANVVIDYMKNSTVWGLAAHCSRLDDQLLWKFCCWSWCMRIRLTRIVRVSADNSLWLPREIKPNLFLFERASVTRNKAAVIRPVTRRVIIQWAVNQCVFRFSDYRYHSWLYGAIIIKRTKISWIVNHDLTIFYPFECFNCWVRVYELSHFHVIHF